MNIIITHAMSLLIFIINVEHTIDTRHVDQLRHALTNKITEFNNSMETSGVNEREMLAARYCVCTSIDEAILKSNLSIATQWGHQTLLSLFHNDTCGGERFYAVIDVALQNPPLYLQIIELCYVLLSIGFEGMFFADKYHQIESIRHDLFQIINNKHSKITRSLSLPREIVNKKTHHPYRQIINKKALIATALFSFIIFITFNVAGYQDTNKTLYLLSHIAQESPITAYSQLINRPIINYDKT